MTKTMRNLLLLLLLALPSISCGPEPDFAQPREGALTGPDVAFVLILPGGEATSVELDGQVVPPHRYAQAGARVKGFLPGLAPGVHELVVHYDFLGGLASAASTWFEVVADASFQVQGSVGQVFVTHAEPGQGLELRRKTGPVLATGEADYQGSLIFRDLPPAADYQVFTAERPRQASAPVAVLPFEGSTPPQEFYDSQVLEPGFGYVTMRDGTKLSVFVSLPGPQFRPNGNPRRYPTLVNYSGYSPSKPGAPLSIGGGIDLEAFCPDFPVLCDAPDHPSGLIAGVMGFATVGVNMRGTGCSGGAYDYFEPLQLTDGYDMIEIIAAQPFVRQGRVGMAGISYPGISQLFTASMQPPSLAAITPLSVISGVDTTLGPGGIINNGFAVEWGTNVLNRADPYGQGWEQSRVDAGDTICEENQLLHSQKVDIIEKAYANPFYTPEVYDPLNPRTFVDKIRVPVFTTGQWQDEQTGGHFPDLWNRFTGVPEGKFRFTGTNGAHADGYSPQILEEWKYFLDFYVAERVVDVPFLIRLFAPLLFEEIFGAPVGIAPHRFLSYATFEEALAAYEAEPPGRIIFESGADPDLTPGAPSGSFELPLSEWPPPATEARRFYLHEDGSLRDFPPSEVESASAFQHANEKGAETYVVNDPFEKALPDIQWLPWQPGRQAVWLTEPLAEDLVLLGHASADLWIQSTAEDADLEVMISEVRPDGQEAYVTSGWLRASRRKLDEARSTPLKPVQTHLEEDAAPLPAGQWELVRVEIYPFGHVFRAGSQLRVSVSTPGANKGRWKFDVLQYDGPVTHGISHSAAYPSSLLLPAIPGVSVPDPLPPCPGLRSQPCRDYVPHPNAVW